MAVPAHLRKTVIKRAGNRCEYCLLSQLAQEATFHIDHVIPQSAGGATNVDNLALACVTCSLRKAARQSVLDAESGTEVLIFSPRLSAWNTHFGWAGVRVIGLTAMGRATIDVLQMNRPAVLAIREEERLRGHHPNV